MLAYRDGDARAFDTLYTRYKGPLYRYLLRQCSGAAVAEELFQDIYAEPEPPRLGSVSTDRQGQGQA